MLPAPTTPTRTRQTRSQRRGASTRARLRRRSWVSNDRLPVLDCRAERSIWGFKENSRELTTLVNANDLAPRVRNLLWSVQVGTIFLSRLGAEWVSGK